MVGSIIQTFPIKQLCYECTLMLKLVTFLSLANHKRYGLS